jgi:hypothetical protein
MVFVVTRRQIVLGFCLIAVVWFAAAHMAPRPETVAQTLPERLTDSEFWSLITEFSEPGGYFRSDNFVSNESAFQRVIPNLKKRLKPGGVYLGVGPDQNFTYTAALAPKLAFIVDIRRQNMLLHLMYKALFELSATRSDFLSRLFARPVPPGLPETATTEELFQAFGKTASDRDLAEQTLDMILQQLRERHGFDLTLDDSKTIEFVYNAFGSGGPEIRYSFPNQYAWRRFPSYSELMLETDGTAENGGENHSYMASEGNFQTIKRMEAENRIIPIVGNFAGEKALRSVGRYVRDHGATVSVFYTSNVEFYLFQTEDWRKFFNTVSGLPMDKNSMFIRSYFNNYGLQFPDPPGWLYSPPQSYTLVESVPSLTGAFAAGRIRNYLDVIRRSAP